MSLYYIVSPARLAVATWPFHFYCMKLSFRVSIILCSCMLVSDIAVMSLTHLFKTHETWETFKLQIPDIFHHPFGPFCCKIHVWKFSVFCLLINCFYPALEAVNHEVHMTEPTRRLSEDGFSPLALLLMFKPGEKPWGSVTLDEWLHLWFMAHLMYFSVTLPNRILINHHIFVLAYIRETVCWIIIATWTECFLSFSMQHEMDTGIYFFFFSLLEELVFVVWSNNQCCSYYCIMD